MHEEYQCYRKLWFRHYYQWIILQVALPLWVLEVLINCITGVTIHIIKSWIQRSWFDTTVGLVLFLRHSFPTLAHIIARYIYIFIRVYLNGIRNVTIHLNVPKNYEFHTNVGRLRLFLQNIAFTYDLANDITQNNLNRMHVFLLISVVWG